MKKIVGILAAAAVLATSVFAADVSAKVKLDGSLLNVDGTKDKTGVSAVSIQHNTDESWNPVISLATSGDNYGASVSFYVGNWNATKMGGWNSGYGIGAKEWKIWIKPVDVLKFNIGRIDASLFTESIDWSNRTYNYDEWGYQAEIAAGGFSLNLGLHMGNPGDSWLTQYLDKNNNSAITISGLGVKAAYSADFGSIAALFDFKGGKGTWTAATAEKKEVAILADGSIGIKTTAAKAASYKYDPASLFFGAGYQGQFDAFRLFFDAGLKMGLPEAGDATIGLIADIDAKYAKDAFYFEAYGKLTYANFKATVDPIELLVLAKVSYNVGPCTIYAYFKDSNVVAKTFASEIRLGANGNVGAASWDIYGKLETGKGDGSKIAFSIPVSFAVAF